MEARLFEPSQFPEGTEVSLYPESALGGAPWPVGASITTAVAEGGEVTFTIPDDGIDTPAGPVTPQRLASQVLIAHAKVEGTHRMVRFHPKASMASEGAHGSRRTEPNQAARPMRYPLPRTHR
jgi:hypothetical protein